MRRGEIRRVDFEPGRGSEPTKRRPAVIVSNEGANRAVALRGRGVLTVIPLSANLREILPFQVFVPGTVSGLRRDSKAQIEHVRGVDISRVGPVIGSVPASLMRELEDALRIQLVL